MNTISTVVKSRTAVHAVTVVLIAILAVTTVQATTSVPASAHSYGHECTGRSNSGFSCVLVSAGAEGGYARVIETYYDGTYRGAIFLFFSTGTRHAYRIQVCDASADDDVRPHARVRKKNGDHVNYAPPQGAGCRSYSPDFTVVRYRLVNYGHDGNANHGTIFYNPAG